MRRILYAVILGVIFSPHMLYASTTSDVKKGNLLYNNKKYDEAVKVYDAALEKKSDNGMLRFNKACALYKKENYNGAIESYNKALASGQARIIPQADYNIGIRSTG